MKWKFVIIPAILVTFFALPQFVFAQSSSSSWASCGAANANQPASLQCIPVVISALVDFLLMFAGVVAVFLIALSGFKYVTSQGDPAKLDSARKTFFYAIAGLLLIVFAYFIVTLVAKVVGVQHSVIGIF